MSGILHGLVEAYHHQLDRHRNRPFLRGTMAACALVATADGEVSFGERMRIDQILETLDALKVFDPHEGVNLFNEFADAILTNPEQGRAEATEALHTVAGGQETNDLLVRVCLAVSEANGAATAADRTEIIKICRLLDVDPASVGLADEAAVGKT